MKTVLKISKFFVEMGFFLSAALIVLYVTYYFGWSLLPEWSVWGNDTASALNNVYYLDTWFPPIPKWIHLWSGGMPFLQVYPGAPFFVTFAIHRLFPFTIFESAKLLLFFSVALAALGTAVLGRILTKNWWVGLLAGVIMILSPDSWLQITYGGFFAIASSVPLFAWTLVFFCLSMEKKSYWWGVLAAAFSGLTWLFHPMAGLLVAVAMGIFGLGYGVKNFGWKQIWKGAIWGGLIIILGVMLFGWWIFPFMTRGDVSGITLGSDQMFRSTIRELVGMDWPANTFAGTYNTTTLFAGSAIVAFLIGAVVVFFRKNILLISALLACTVALFIMTAPYYAMPLVKIFNLFWAATNVRASLIIRILGPIIGAYGVMSLTRPLFWGIEKLAKKLKDKTWWFYLTSTIGAFVGLAVFWFIFNKVVILPPKPKDPDFGLIYSGYGPLRTWMSLVRINGKEMIVDLKTNRVTPVYKDQKTMMKELPKIFSLVGGKDPMPNIRAELITNQIKLSSKERIDISPFQGELTGALGNYSEAAQVPSYVGTSVIQTMVGWEINCVYYDPLCGPKDIEDLYRWWGVTQAWPGDSQQSILDRLNQVKTLELQNYDWAKIAGTVFNWPVYRFMDSTGLASITNKPAILVIGENPPNNDSYYIVFKVMPRIGWGYDKAWTIHGSKYIDDYDLKTLSQFEIIILHAYQAKNRDRAWSLLQQYVNQGGRLLIDAGWQYYAQDWGTVNREDKSKFMEYLTPSIFPVSKTIWTRLSSTSPTLASDFDSQDLEGWASLSWDNQPWAMSLAKSEWLKPGAKSLLTVDGKVVIAEQSIGRGKIVWSGFDFFGHLLRSRSAPEEKFMENVFSSVAGDFTNQEKQLDFTRIEPQLIKIDYQKLPGNNKLMFKEVASSNWRATLSGSKTTIYSAGPGWKMIFLPEKKQSGEAIFNYHKNKLEMFGLIVSVASLIFVLIYGLMRFVKKGLDQKILRKIKSNFNRGSQKMKESWENEEG